MSARPQRIAIIGNGGGGKSRLARRLGAALGLPVHVVDDVQWLPGWVPALLADVARAHDEWLASGRWIIDGWGAWDLLEQRFLAADVVILVDLPFARHLWWAARRHVNAALGRSEGWPPPGCRVVPITGRLLRVMWWVHREQRPRLIARLSQPDLRERFVHIRNPRALQDISTILHAALGAIPMLDSESAMRDQDYEDWLEDWLEDFSSVGKTDTELTAWEERLQGSENVELRQLVKEALFMRWAARILLDRLRATGGWPMPEGSRNDLLDYVVKSVEGRRLD